MVRSRNLGNERAKEGIEVERFPILWQTEVHSHYSLGAEVETTMFANEICIFFNRCLWTTFFFHGANSVYWARSSSLSRLYDHTQTHTLGRTPLAEWSARRRDFYLTTHKIYKGQTSMPPAGFEPAIQASERLQTDALKHEATGIWTILLNKTGVLMTPALTFHSVLIAVWILSSL
jgi:hypothetical protein